MPMVAAAVASAVTWVSSAAAAVSAAAVGWLATPFVMAMGEGAAIAMASGVLKVSAMALGSFALNAVMAPKVGSAGSPTSFKADPSSPIRGVMGRFGTGGTQAHFRVWGKNNLMISYVAILSLGPIQGVANFTANNLTVNFTGPNGEAAKVEPYRDKMWMTYKTGLPTDGSLTPPPTGGSPAMEWYSYHRTSGYAGAFWTMQNNSKRASYEGGVPKPMWEVLGQKLYDPRKDSTQTGIGGSGSHRIDDWQTWEFTENPIIHALNWALGHHKKLEGGIIDRSKLLAGVGAPLSHIDLPTFVAGANVSDINNWKISGEWNTQDGKWQTLVGMLQAGSSVPVHVGAKIGIMTNAPRTHVAVIQGSDILGNTNIKVMASSRARFNTVYPRYINKNQNWEYGTAGAVTSAVYVDQDRGVERPKEITYNYVSDPKQAAELAAYDLANTRETLKMAFASKPHHIGIKPGDAVLVNSPERGLLNQKFIVVARPIDIMEGGISFDLRSETDSKHPWALGQTSQPAPSPGLLPFDPTPTTPGVDEWQIIPRPADPDGSQQPGFILVGTVPDGIGSVLFETSAAPAGPWTTAYSGPPTTETVRINGLIPGADYYVAVTYISVKGLPSERRIWGPYTAPSLVALSSVKFPDGSSPIWNYDTYEDLPVPPEDDQNLAFVTGEDKLYTWDSASNTWTKKIDGGDIAPETLSNIAFVAGLKAPGLGPVRPTLPDREWPEGSMFVDTTDGKTYTNRGGIWSSSIDASDIVGTVPSGIPYGPANPGTGSPDQLFHNTTDGKLYRWNSPGGWTTAADGADLVANSITTNKIAVGSITTALLGAGAVIADKIAADAVTTGKIAAGAVVANTIAADAVQARHIAVSDMTNLAPNGFWDVASLVGSWVTVNASVTFVDGAGNNGRRGLSMVTSSGRIETSPNKLIPVSDGEQFVYAVPVRSRGTPSSNGLYLRVTWWKADGTPHATTYSSILEDGPITDGGYQNFTGTVTAPVGARLAGLQVWKINATATEALISSVTFRRKNAGSLIVDGAIVTNLLAANAVTADKILAGAVTAAKINVTNLAAINADMGTITAGIIRSGTTGIRTEITPLGGKTYHANGQIAVEWGVFP